MILKTVVLLACVVGIRTFPMEEPEDGGKHWVVIVAGSNGWYNYRHQVRSTDPAATPQEISTLGLVGRMIAA